MTLSPHPNNLTKADSDASMVLPLPFKLLRIHKMCLPPWLLDHPSLDSILHGLSVLMKNLSHRQCRMMFILQHLGILLPLLLRIRKMCMPPWLLDHPSLNGIPHGLLVLMKNLSH